MVPAPEAGHVLPFAHVARTLRRDGFRVVFLTGAHCAAFLLREGFEVHTFSGGAPDPAHPRRIFHPNTAGESFWKREWRSVDTSCSIASLFLRRLLETAETLQPCLTVVDRVFHPRPIGVMEQFSAGWPVSYLATSLLHREDDLPMNDTDCVVLCPPELLSADDRARFSGVAYGEPAISFSRRARHGEMPVDHRRRPLVYCAFGSQQCRHREMADRLDLLLRLAARRPELDFVLAVRTRGKPAPTLPPNVTCQTPVPQLQMLQRASLFITHGGMGSIKEAVYHGVPMLCWPLCFDQPFNSACVRNAGLGEVLPEEQPSLETLTGAVDLLLDRSPALTASLSRYRSLFRERQRLPLTARLLERRIRTSTMPPCQLESSSVRVSAMDARATD